MQKLQIVVVVLLIMAIAAGAVVYIIQRNTSGGPIEIVLAEPSAEIVIDVSGEVIVPGLYTLSEGDRTEDAIEAAGGFTDIADQSSINMARHLRDGDHIHVYGQGDSRQRININTAEDWLLEALPGIGQATARAIIEYRTEHGRFEEIEDIKKIKGIGETTFEKLADKITVH